MAIVGTERPHRALVRELFDRAPVQAVLWFLASISSTILLLLPLTAGGVAAYYLAEGRELLDVTAAALVAALLGLAAESLRRWRPWRRVLVWGLAPYAHRPGDESVHLEIAARDVRSARRVLRKAGYFADVPYWRTQDAVQIEARYRPDARPAEEPERTLEREGIKHRRVGHSVSLGPGSARPA